MPYITDDDLSSPYSGFPVLPLMQMETSAFPSLQVFALKCRNECVVSFAW